ncbi:MAG: hypothetical protein WCG08_15460, partial [Paludibacter sp.]
DVFFVDIKIDKKTGLVEGKNKRFATMPYIGKKYQEAKKKILFVGTDIGEDEYARTNRFQSFEEREENVFSSNNPHIAGTYVTALYFLKEIYNWGNYYEQINKNWTCQKARKSLRNLPTEVLEYISLTNYYKFVTVDRENERSGGKDRVFNSIIFEKKIFQDEIMLLNPDIIIFQSVKFANLDLIPEIINMGIEVYVAPHPSNRAKNGRVPNEYISQIIKK